ncbi:hypothetical protein DXG03_007843 [Asterophora parasitica]|uniref:Uncharacterized protein n=1 Tax=Asterophora parasitica TaxID=117018 RepID=A0A9P7GCD5_9AGAR|nr:hypothetical protein DXG03_007843 [Asterophora parasitica]
MSLDQNLFTLNLVQHKDDPHVVDLIDPSGTIHYRKQRVLSPEYKAEVYDPISQSLLITATSPTVTGKAKTLELYNPTILVDLKYTGTLSFRWGFKWEEHDFEWKREECFMLRKPDPPVLVAVTREPAGRLKTTSVQILDYNLNRFDINDRKGLEIVILTALLVFQDVNEGYRNPQEASPAGTPAQTPGGTSAARGTLPSSSTPPRPPPKPAPKTGVDRIAEMQAEKGEYNEISVEEEGKVNDYAEYCARLLGDDAMLFVTLRSAAAEQVPKVLQVVEQTKRIRHKAGLSEGAELHQYVLYDTGEKQRSQGPRRINLDDNAKPSKSSYSPPTSLTVHLSKIDMPELQPKATTAPDRHGHANTKDADHGKDPKKKEIKKEDKKGSNTPTPSSDPRPGKLGKHHPPASPTSSQPKPAGPPSHYTPQPPPPSMAFPTPQVPPSLGSLNADWNRPQRNSFHAGANSSANAHAPYGSSAYAPPPPTHPHSKPSNSGSGYSTTYPTYRTPARAPSPSSQAQWQPPLGPPPAIPPRPPAQAGESAPTQKPTSTSIVGGLFDSFRRR